MSHSLPIVCPGCALVFPVEAGLTDAEARRAVVAAIGLWPAEIKAHAMRYFTCFAPAKNRPNWMRLAQVLDEFVALVQSGQVTRDRETRPAPLALWAEGLTAVLEMRASGTLDLPLKDHALLCEIVHRRARRAATQQEAATRPLHPSHRPADPESLARPDRGTATRAIGEVLAGLGHRRDPQPKDDQHD